MLNQYKIDANRYFDARHPYALYLGRRAWWGGTKWEHLGSFQTKEEAREAHRLLVDLPIYLTGSGHAMPATDPRNGL